ncbi:MAG: glycosyltransferase family 4 protein [Ardenticatenaceae bacterium]|nr:glycosyltransferase family 4 protein [Ardenticatenaceae bacterium]
MRIGFDGTPLLGQRVGIGNYTAHLLGALLHNHPTADYYLYSNRPLDQLEPALQRAIPIPGHFPRSRLFWMQFILPRLLRHSIPDLCHYANASAPLWPHQQPFVLTIHDASLFLHHHYHPWSRLIAIRALLPALARRAAAIITVSQQAKADLIQALHLPPAKIHVIYEAPPPHFAPSTDPVYLARLRQQYQLPEKFILYLGTLEPRKNLARLVQAIHRLHQQGCPVRLVMAGPKGWHMNGFQEEIGRLEADKLVQYLGYVPTADLPGLYTLATIFAFPSLYEGFGLPPLEAMACATPVLTSRNSAMAEVGGDAVYLVNPYATEELADGLRHLLQDDALREELGQRGWQRAQQFSWQQAAAATTAVYHHVLHPT